MSLPVEYNKKKPGNRRVFFLVGLNSRNAVRGES